MEIGTLPLVIDTSHARYISASEEGVEEIIRSPKQLQRQSSSYADRSRCTHAPIRRRLHIDDFSGKAYQIYDFSTAMAPRTSLDSAGSSGTDPWSSTGFVEEEDDDDESADFVWEEEGDAALVAPKLEPMDDVNMAEFSVIEVTEAGDKTVAKSPPASSTPQKKGRGRPRKHPLPTPESLAKVAKGRSKTGCITCRKRKKKCDERKPTCEIYEDRY